MRPAGRKTHPEYEVSTVSKQRRMPHINLKSGIALMALAIGVAVAVPGLAEPTGTEVPAAHKTAKPAKKPAAKPAASKPADSHVRVTGTFKGQARTAAGQTMKVMQTGTSAADQTKQTLLPDSGVVACPEGKADSAAWKDVPEEIRNSAKPGQCFAKLITSPKAETYTDHVLMKPERTQTRMVPAVIDWVDKDVLVRPEHVIHKNMPAVTHTEMVTEVVRDATSRDETVPAQYEMRVEHVLVRPAHQEWVKTRAIPTQAPMVTPDGRAVHSDQRGYLTWPGKTPQNVPETEEARRYLKDGNPPFVWCLKDIPAVYEDKKVRVEVAPATTRHIDIPAVTRQVSKVVVDSPAHVEDVTIPAVYEKHKVKTVVVPAHSETYTTPAEYRDVEKTRLVGKADVVWREVICNKNAKPDTVMAIQKALTDKGYYHGKVDGDLGPSTVAAMQRYQADQGLPQGQISVESVQMLGVPLN
jgi:hypothetical protein